jgi:hypothetical protein
MTRRSNGRRAQVLSVLQARRTPLDDDQIAQAVDMNRHYVNAICRQLAVEQLISRVPGAEGKLVNIIVDPGRPAAALMNRGHGIERRGLRSPDRGDNLKMLIADFARYVSLFEAGQVFGGPSLYFHERAIERQRQHKTVTSLLGDKRFLEYVYAVLPSWGMHRMGRQKAKVGDFQDIVDALCEQAPALESLWSLQITSLGAEEAHEVATIAWDVIAHIKVSTSRTQIVAGSKTLHHLFPDLIPPIDRQYTFRFFTGQMAVASDRAAFLEWFPRLADVGSRCREPIYDAISRRGFMATGEAKVIDNAIMGFMQQYRR